jgi:hypothetical protein
MMNEKNVALSGRSVSAAAARITELAAEMDYSAVPTAPRTYQLVRTRRRRLMAKRVETMVVTLVEDRSGTRARITGDIDELFLQHLDGVDAGSERRYENSVPVGSAMPPPAPPPPPPAQHIASAPTPQHERSTVRPSSNPSGLIAAVPGASGAMLKLPPPQPVAREGDDDSTRDNVDHGHAPNDADVVERTMMRPERHVVSAEVQSPTIETSDGRRVSLETAIVIGRNPDATRGGGGATSLSINDRSISKTHAVIGLDGDELVVTDLHSSNGTRLEIAGRTSECEPGVPVRVPIGDVTVHLGSASFNVRASQ